MFHISIKSPGESFAGTLKKVLATNDSILWVKGSAHSVHTETWTEYDIVWTEDKPTLEQCKEFDIIIFEGLEIGVGFILNIMRQFPFKNIFVRADVLERRLEQLVRLMRIEQSPSLRPSILDSWEELERQNGPSGFSSLEEFKKHFSV